MAVGSRINKRVPWDSFRQRRKFNLLEWAKKKRIYSYDDLVTHCQCYHIYPPGPDHKDSLLIYSINGVRGAGNEKVNDVLWTEGNMDHFGGVMRAYSVEPETLDAVVESSKVTISSDNKDQIVVKEKNIVTPAQDNAVIKKERDDLWLPDIPDPVKKQTQRSKKKTRQKISKKKGKLNEK